MRVSVFFLFITQLLLIGAVHALDDVGDDLPTIDGRFEMDAADTKVVMPVNDELKLDKDEETSSAKQKAPKGPALEALSSKKTARMTFYNPNSSSSMEGGPRNRYQEPIHSVEDAIQKGVPISVAADVYGSFGKECNQKDRRCTLLFHAKGFDRLFPEYRKRFRNLPKDTFIGIVEDTGGAFFHAGPTHFDLAVRSRALANATPSFFQTHVSWARVENPCGDGADSRNCHVAMARPSGELLAFLNVDETL